MGLDAKTRRKRFWAVVLISAGVTVFLDVATTLVAGEPLSALFTSFEQDKAHKEFEEFKTRFGGSEDLSEKEILKKAQEFREEIEIGQGIAQIRIEKLGGSYTVVEGIDEETLKKGPGHYPMTALPGEGRSVAVTGHRTTYLAPFKRLNELSEGDTIFLEMPYAEFYYEVEETEIVDPTDVEILNEKGYERLILTACHPLYSAAQRIVVFARLKRVAAD